MLEFYTNYMAHFSLNLDGHLIGIVVIENCNTVNI